MIAKRGSFLLPVMIFTFVIAGAISTVLWYFSASLRIVKSEVSDDLCRFAAQSQIEVAKSLVADAFNAYVAQFSLVGANIAIGIGSSAFDWFGVDFSSQTPQKSIGILNPVSFSKEIRVYDRYSKRDTDSYCTVKVGIVRVKRDHTNDSYALVTFAAEAERAVTPSLFSRITAIETVSYKIGRSRVFDHAYFVNNKGGLSDGSSIVNGDVRANGDFFLANNARVNGRVFASRNDEIGSLGDITDPKAGAPAQGLMDTESQYRSNYAKYGSLARPLKTDPRTGQEYAGGYEASETGMDGDATDTDLKARIFANQPSGIEMPFIGDLTSDQSEYKRWAESLHKQDPNLSTIKQGGSTLVSVCYDGPGPSRRRDIETATGEIVRAPDYGAIVLRGTRAKPIEINGPVIIPNDVIISGVVTGQGVIYSGRNIHIIGDIEYLDPPDWSGNATSASNASKDILGLMAKGNVVFGDYTPLIKNTSMGPIEVNYWLDDIAWRNDQTKTPYKCDPSDAEIGYPENFNGDYVAVERLSASEYLKAEKNGFVTTTPGGYDPATEGFGKMREKPIYKQIWNADLQIYIEDRTQIKDYEPYAAFDRRYYETVCDDIYIQQAQPISRIDAVLYNNHGFIGKIGNMKPAHLNGALICRDQLLGYDVLGGFYINWDIRLYSRSLEGLNNATVGFPKGTGFPETTEWTILSGSYFTFE